MKTTLRILLSTAFISMVLLSGCIKRPVINFDMGFFSDTVKNLSTVNSAFDDFNSSGPGTIPLELPLVFSSNRYTEGKKYDLINYQIYIYFDQTTGVLSLSGLENQAYPYMYLAQLSNTTFDEFGPYTSYLGGQEYLFTFASNRAGNMDIYFSYFDDVTFGGTSPINPTILKLKGLSTTKYEAYATLDANLKQVIFASNRDDDNIDLYRIKFPENVDYYAWANRDTLYPAEKVTVLNSDSTDMFPYINKKLLVFSSKRSGGYGGYDLYYSLHNGTEWGEPVNFGPTINTPYDEYRPVAFFAPYFTNDLLIFSSNRPGGLGGIDLYYVGIDKTLQSL